MALLRTISSGLKSLFRGTRLNQDMDEELSGYLDSSVDAKVRSGMSRAEASRAARVEMGSVDSVKQKVWSVGWESVVEDLWADVRYGVRMLRKNLGFTAIVVLSLALGIGANTAIFSLIDAVMLKFLPVKDPEQLVLLKWVSPQQPKSVESMSGDWDQDKTGRIASTAFPYPTFKELQANHNIFSSTFAFSDTGKINVKANGQAELAEGELASGDYFSGLGVRAVEGRLFTDSDDREESPPTAVISYGYWERRFGRNRSVVGKAITINGTPFTIIGVTEPEFFGLRPGTLLDVWMPLSTQPLIEPSWTENGKSKFLWRGDWWLLVMGRLQPAVSHRQALAQLDVVFKQSVSDPQAKLPTLGRAETSQPGLPTLEFVPGGKGLRNLRDEFSEPLFILMVVVGLVLMIACANVANLLLSRATSRYREIAVRTAVGAQRLRLIRQLLTESTLLAALGGVFGLGLAYGVTRLLVTLMSSGQVPVNLSVRPDLHVLGFTAAISLFTGVLFGLVPALRATHFELTSALKEDSRGSIGHQRHGKMGLGQALVVSQVTMSLLLLVGSGLFVRTLVNLEKTNIGFDRRNILLFEIDPTQNGYKGERLARLYEQLQQKIKALPGVRSATFSTVALIGGHVELRVLTVEGHTINPTENEVGPSFFETMGIPIVLGRPIEEGDKSGTLKIAVVNETFARKCFGNSNPIGHRFGHGIDNTAPDTEIVGVVADTKYQDLRTEMAPTIFVPLSQSTNSDAVAFEVRSVGDPRDLIPSVRHAVQDVDPNVPLAGVRTQVEQIEQSLFQERLFAKLSSFFGLLALILACIGMYGITSYTVAQRTNEIGIRMALGARQEVILRDVLLEASVLVLMGIAIGIPIALGCLRLISSMLFGLKPTDPLTLAAATAFMLAIAAIASYLPARRASRINPMVALRYE